MTTEPTSAGTLFLHVPKTAGSTCNWLIRQNYRREHQVLIRRYFHEMDVPVREAQDLLAAGRRPRIISSHMSFGLHEALPGHWRYACFLREPVRRVISAYRYVRQVPRQPLHKAAWSMSLPELLDSGLYLDGDNGQVRRLSGVGTTLPLGACTRETLDLAVANIERHFSAVGLTERFDESALLLADALGWRGRPFYWTQNRTTNRGGPPPTDGQTLASISRYNELDLQLYQYASQRLEAEIARRGDAFERAVRTFQFLNRTYFPVRLLPTRVAAKARYELTRHR